MVPSVTKVTTKGPRRPPDDDEADRLLRLRDVAALLQVSEKLVRRLTLRKGLRYVRIGRELRFKRAWVHDFIERGDRRR